MGKLAFILGVSFGSLLLGYGVRILLRSFAESGRTEIVSKNIKLIATFVLVLAVGALNSRFAVPNGAAPGLSPYLVSCVVWGIGLGLGGTTGYAINPARDFGPRLAHSILPIHGKGKTDWSYAPIPILGPAIGALLAAYLIKFISG